MSTSPQPPARTIWLGREREIAELESGLADLQTGRGGLFLVTGEPGIGKTRLADEVGRLAVARGVSVHWGRAWEAGGAPSYWPFIQALRHMCHGIDANELAAMVGARGPELAELLPELRSRLPGLGPSHPELTIERFQLFDAIGTFLKAAAAQAPRLVVLDDLHAADLSSLQLLHFLVRDLRSGPLMMLGTYREAEARLASEVGRTLTLAAREATVLPLRRLDREQVSDYLARATGAAPSADAVEALYRRTEGNPLFLLELLRLLGPGRESPTRLPEGIAEVVRARLSLLAPAVHDVLGPAAVLGREFSLEALGALTEQSPTAVAAAISPAADAGIVEPLDAPIWRFTHMLLCDGLYDALAPERRTLLHRAAALEIRSRGGEVPLSEVAHHLLRAVPAVPVDDAASAAIAAADVSMALLAFEDAAALLERTAKLLEGAQGAERRLAEVLVSFGVARIRTNDLATGKAACIRAAGLARAIGDGEQLARAALGAACDYAAGVRELQLISLLEEALAALPAGDSALRARCMAQLAAERQPEPDTRPPVELARAAVAMARRLGDGATLRATISTASLAMMVYGDPDERLALNEEALRLALAAGDKVVAMRAHLLCSLDGWDRGDFTRGEAHVQAFFTLVRASGREATVIACTRNAGDALRAGRFDEAERWHLEALARVEEDPVNGRSVRGFRAGWCRAAERYHDAPAIEAQLRADFGAVQQQLGGCMAEMMIAAIHGRAGDRVRSAAQLATVRAHPVFGTIEEPGFLALLVDACHLLDDAALAAKLYPALLPRAAQWFHLGPMGGFCEPPYDRQLGLLAETLGRRDEAVAHLTAAEAETARVEARGHLARIRFELAGALISRDAPGDRERARSLLEQARALAEELGQTALIPRIAERAAQATPSRAEAPSTQVAALTLRREGDYWTLTWGGPQGEGGRALRLRDSRGLQVLDRLMASPGQELHVLQLVGAGDGVADGGDAGAMLDDAAVQSYRRRLLDLRAELEEAEQFADAGRASRAREEMDFLTQELARALGLGGRSRRAGGAAERARTAVQKRLRAAIRRIADEHAVLGEYLEAAVRTGTFCSFQPPSFAPVPTSIRSAADDSARAQSEKIASLGELVAGIAHEMNTPLGALRANVDMATEAWGALREALQDEELAEIVSKHKRLMRAFQVLERTQGVTPEATRRISGVVDQLKSFARVDQADVGPLALSESVDNALALSSHKIGDRIEIVRRFGDVPAVVCRASLVNQVVLSLITNAIQAIDGSGRITLTTERSGDDVLLRVTDTGCGIAAEHRDRIFDPGFTTKGVGVGLGLGLSLSHRIATEHGGRIDVESAPGKGATFTLRIPAAGAGIMLR